MILLFFGIYNIYDIHIVKLIIIIINNIDIYMSKREFRPVLLGSIEFTTGIGAAVLVAEVDGRLAQQLEPLPDEAIKAFFLERWDANRLRLGRSSRKSLRV